MKEFALSDMNLFKIKKPYKTYFIRGLIVLVILNY